jgi:hypothetical protein
LVFSNPKSPLVPQLLDLLFIRNPAFTGGAGGGERGVSIGGIGNWEEIFCSGME